VTVDGAGLILVREFNVEKKFLGLIGHVKMQKRSGGIFDIPKGCLDANENLWDCAVRETREEVGIQICPNDIIAGPFNWLWLTVWLCKTDQNPVIKPNPHSGILEHNGYEWLKPQELSGLSYIYLKPYVDWAIEELA
jgi:8-oxo-dGTP pyrophosphatase MutT (NUDIX family)